MTHIEEIYKFLLDENESTFQNYLNDNFEIDNDELLIKIISPFSFLACIITIFIYIKFKSTR